MPHVEWFWIMWFGLTSFLIPTTPMPRLLCLLLLVRLRFRILQSMFLQDATVDRDPAEGQETWFLLKRKHSLS